MGDLSDNFSRHEFECKCGCGAFIECPELVKALEKVRAHFGRKVTITSGTRCEEHNKAVGGRQRVNGKGGSMHLYGKAADFVVAGVPPVTVQEVLRGFDGGLGSYKSFTHIDVRGYKARW